MLYNSIELYACSGLFLLLTIAMPKIKVALLLFVTALIYYIWQPAHFWVLPFISFFAYLGGVHLHFKKNRSVLVFYLFILIAPIIFLKYLGAHIFTANSFIIPLGISFFTLQCIGYIVDVYWGVATPTKSFSGFALFATFYPQLVAGPIERFGNLYPQLNTKEIALTISGLCDALARMLLGLIKKFVFADLIASLILPAIKNYQDISVFDFILSTLLIRYFIFFDLSGYTDIAVGISRLFNIRLTENFNSPFASTSIVDFWKRWHITLSSWIRDYIFYPLTASPVGRFGVAPLVLLSFLFLGVWHDFTKNYLLYGVHQAVLVIATYYFSKKIKFNINRQLSIFASYVLIIAPASLYLVINSDQSPIAMLFKYYHDLFSLSFLSTKTQLLKINREHIVSTFLIIFGCTSTYLVHAGSFSKKIFDSFYGLTPAIKLLLLCVMFVFLLTFGFFDNDSFVYFHF